MSYMDLNPSKPIAIVGEMPVRNCGIGFSLTGNSTILSSKDWPSYSVKPGLSSHYIGSEPMVVKEILRGGRKINITIGFDSKILSDLANEDEAPFLPFLKGIGKQAFEICQRKMDPEMRRALNQIITCPYSGKTRTLFIEGKAMEIFARKLEQIRAKGKSLPRQPRISKSDTERIHYAAQLLVRDPVNPPNLSDLAGKIGMSRSKFYQNFKIVFGHSPMDHLRSHRLQVARQLLRQGNYNVTEVVFAVGYNNLSNFTKIFFSEFGVYPNKVI